MLIVLACLTGIVLGLTFNVVALLPFAFAGGFVCALKFADQGPGIVAASFLVSALSVQGGYMIGLTGRDLLAQILTRLNTVQSRRI
jgi:hypothetical protein